MQREERSLQETQEKLRQLWRRNLGKATYSQFMTASKTILDQMVKWESELEQLQLQDERDQKEREKKARTFGLEYDANRARLNELASLHEERFAQIAKLNELIISNKSKANKAEKRLAEWKDFLTWFPEDAESPQVPVIVKERASKKTKPVQRTDDDDEDEGQVQVVASPKPSKPPKPAAPPRELLYMLEALEKLGFSVSERKKIEPLGSLYYKQFGLDSEFEAENYRLGSLGIREFFTKVVNAGFFDLFNAMKRLQVDGRVFLLKFIRGLVLFKTADNPEFRNFFTDNEKQLLDELHRHIEKVLPAVELPSSPAKVVPVSQKKTIREEFFIPSYEDGSLMSQFEISEQDYEDAVKTIESALLATKNYLQTNGLKDFITIFRGFMQLETPEDVENSLTILWIAFISVLARGTPFLSPPFTEEAKDEIDFLAFDERAAKLKQFVETFYGLSRSASPAVSPVRRAPSLPKSPQKMPSPSPAKPRSPTPSKRRSRSPSPELSSSGSAWDEYNYGGADDENEPHIKEAHAKILNWLEDNGGKHAVFNRFVERGFVANDASGREQFENFLDDMVDRIGDGQTIPTEAIITKYFERGRGGREEAEEMEVSSEPSSSAGTPVASPRVERSPSRGRGRSRSRSPSLTRTIASAETYFAKFGGEAEIRQRIIQTLNEKRPFGRGDENETTATAWLEIIRHWLNTAWYPSHYGADPQIRHFDGAMRDVNGRSLPWISWFVPARTRMPSEEARPSSLVIEPEEEEEEREVVRKLPKPREEGGISDRTAIFFNQKGGIDNILKFYITPHVPNGDSAQARRLLDELIERLNEWFADPNHRDPRKVQLEQWSGDLKSSHPSQKLKGKPFWTAVFPNIKSEITLVPIAGCASCGNAKARTKSGCCGALHYCNQDCAQTHWAHHSQKCAGLSCKTAARGRGAKQ